MCEQRLKVKQMYRFLRSHNFLCNKNRILRNTLRTLIEIQRTRVVENCCRRGPEKTNQIVTLRGIFLSCKRSGRGKFIYLFFFRGASNDRHHDDGRTTIHLERRKRSRWRWFQTMQTIWRVCCIVGQDTFFDNVILAHRLPWYGVAAWQNGHRTAGMLGGRSNRW